MEKLRKFLFLRTRGRCMSSATSSDCLSDQNDPTTVGIARDMWDSLPKIFVGLEVGLRVRSG